jgi:hypothetical protein
MPLDPMTTHDLYSWVSDPQFQQLATHFDELLTANASQDQLNQAADAAYTRLTEWLGEVQDQRDSYQPMVDALQGANDADHVNLDASQVHLPPEVDEAFSNAKFSDDPADFQALQDLVYYPQQLIDGLGPYYAYVGNMSLKAMDTNNIFQ